MYIVSVLRFPCAATCTVQAVILTLAVTYLGSIVGNFIGPTDNVEYIIGVLGTIIH